MIAGHRRQIVYLERVLERGTLAHAYLFFGPEAVGKRTIALAFATSLLCRGSGEPKFGGCLPDLASPAPARSAGGGGRQAGGGCESCALAGSGAHPDLIVLSADAQLVPDDSKRASSTSLRAGIGIRNVHELRRRLGLAAWAGGWRAVLIDGADQLSRDAQSALLKLLEEPGGKTVFLLITSAPGVLLPTIRSRAVPMGFAPLGDEELSPFLGRVPREEQSALLTLAAGRPGVLARLAVDREYAASVRKEDARFEKLSNADLLDRFAAADELGREPERLSAFLAFFIRRLRTELLAALGRERAPADGGAAAVSDRAELLRMLLDRASLAEGVALNRRLLVDGILFALERVRPHPSP
ncbi:MAG: hypothetical protein A3B37_02625 [Candidatus Sungbacteria bacterium RIFCSPLOWO2_01_FULL_59_16]|uniref:DNA polymerase III subunit delta n=1 Tax=Candidatus Sungbacteria bacterium RIFCSPLOWO2_01_FULL_59_16 TaxID=1802280 RepID=A0A1G2LD51_9BACT|nr:MAG: hypothetical protein A3B37_02625 [Candidatus Sungbacteria bacterium RIFCSPLOWO2_01_FULL_59_16]